MHIKYAWFVLPSQGWLTANDIQAAAVELIAACAPVNEFVPSVASLQLWGLFHSPPDDEKDQKYGVGLGLATPAACSVMVGPFTRSFQSTATSLSL